MTHGPVTVCGLGVGDRCYKSFTVDISSSHIQCPCIHSSKQSVSDRHSFSQLSTPSRGPQDPPQPDGTYSPCSVHWPPMLYLTPISIVAERDQATALLICDICWNMVTMLQKIQSKSKLSNKQQHLDRQLQRLSGELSTWVLANRGRSHASPALLSPWHHP